MVDLRNLETFVWVAQLGGFRAAADKLHTTQPAISARIAILEDELRVKLFDREQRRATLTAKGFELLGYAERMLQLRADMMQAVTEKMAMRGLIRLGVAETIVHTWLSRLIERLHAVYPSITLEIEVDTTPNLRAALVAHQLDVAFLLGPVSEAASRTIRSAPIRSPGSRARSWSCRPSRCRSPAWRAGRSSPIRATRGPIPRSRSCSRAPTFPRRGSTAIRRYRPSCA